MGLRIAFVSDGVYPWNKGGIETVENLEAKGLAKRHEVHFFSFRWRGMRKDFKKDRITYHTFHDITLEKFYRHGRRSMREALVFTLNMFRLFGYGRFDVMQVNEFPVLHLPIVKLYCKLTGCKMILDVVEVWDKEYWTSYLGPFFGTIADWYARAFIRSGDAYIANSSMTEGKLVAAGIPHSKITVLSPVVDDRFMHRLKPATDNSRIIFVGRLIKEKRLDLWLKAFAQIKERVGNLHGVIVGEGPEEGKLIVEAKRLGIYNDIKFMHFIPRSRLYGLMKGSKMLLQMSEREGLSVIVVESLALGTPVLLPSYSPIPKELKRMCVVSKEKDIVKRAVEMLRSRSRNKYLLNRESMDRFSISKIEDFYETAFKRLFE